MNRFTADLFLDAFSRLNSAVYEHIGVITHKLAFEAQGVHDQYALAIGKILFCRILYEMLQFIRRSEALLATVNGLRCADVVQRLVEGLVH